MAACQMPECTDAKPVIRFSAVKFDRPNKPYSYSVTRDLKDRGTSGRRWATLRSLLAALEEKRAYWEGQGYEVVIDAAGVEA